MTEQILDYIDIFGSILVSVAWAVRSSYNCTTDALYTSTVSIRKRHDVQPFHIGKFEEISLRK